MPPNELPSGVGRVAGQLCCEALVMLEVRHTLDLTAMQLMVCQSRERGMANWELPSWVVSYPPINTTVLKNIQTLFLTKGKGIFRIFGCLFCREIKIQAIKMKTGIGFCKHCCEQSLKNQNYLPVFLYLQIKAFYFAGTCGFSMGQLDQITTPWNKSRADQKHHCFWLQTWWVWRESKEAE